MVLNGSVCADGLNANVPLRGNDPGEVVVNGAVFPGGDSTVGFRNNGEVIVNGNINCSTGHDVRLDFAHLDPGGGI